MAWLGQISYGMFLLHNFTELFIPRWGWMGPLLDSNWKILVLYPGTVLLAWVMWRVVEEPVARLRRK
jgi:peptidoglycan/LPS O-acetylase OafA/YrhL